MTGYFTDELVMIAQRTKGTRAFQSGPMLPARLAAAMTATERECRLHRQLFQTERTFPELLSQE